MIPLDHQLRHRIQRTLIRRLRKLIDNLARLVGKVIGPLPDTLGHAPDGTRPGVVVPAGRPGPLAAALRRWFDEPALRAELRRSARSRRCILSGWEDTGRRLDEALDALRRRPVGVPR